MAARAWVAGGAMGVAAVVGLASPAFAGATLTPKAGSYSGTIAGRPGPLAISFTIGKARKNASALTGTAAVKIGCRHQITAYQLPDRVMALTAAGGFTATEADYIGPKVRVTVTGHFVSATKATGHVVVRFATDGARCNSNRVFTVTRSG